MTTKEKVSELRALQFIFSPSSRPWWYLQGLIDALDGGPESSVLRAGVVKDQAMRLE